MKQAKSKCDGNAKPSIDDVKEEVNWMLKKHAIKGVSFDERTMTVEEVQHKFGLPKFEVKIKFDLVGFRKMDDRRAYLKKNKNDILDVKTTREYNIELLPRVEDFWGYKWEYNNRDIVVWATPTCPIEAPAREDDPSCPS